MSGLGSLGPQGIAIIGLGLLVIGAVTVAVVVILLVRKKKS